MADVYFVTNSSTALYNCEQLLVSDVSITCNPLGSVLNTVTFVLPLSLANLTGLIEVRDATWRLGGVKVAVYRYMVTEGLGGTPDTLSSKCPPTEKFAASEINHPSNLRPPYLPFLGGTVYDNLGGRVVGQIIPAVSGLATLYLSSDDASLMWIGTTTVRSSTPLFISNDNLHGCITASAQVMYTAGVPIDFQIDFNQASPLGPMCLILEHEVPSAGVTRQVMPSSVFRYRGYPSMVLRSGMIQVFGEFYFETTCLYCVPLVIPPVALMCSFSKGLRRRPTSF